MTISPIVDAGPALNFFAANRERILFQCVGAISVPEAVRDEIRNKAASDQRFDHAERVASKVEGRLLTVLPDEETEDLNRVIQRLENMSMGERLRHPRDLGETMVIAHAVVSAESGMNVWILIDELRGSAVATAEKRRLERKQKSDKSVGSLRIINTETVLEKAVQIGCIKDRGQMKKIYAQLRDLDDGLVAIEQTGLLKKSVWTIDPQNLEDALYKGSA